MIITDSTRLANIGLRTPTEIVAAVVRRLSNGESLYSIYHGDGALASKRTIEKIRDLMQAGKLDFIKLPQVAESTIGDVADTADLAGRYGGISPADDFQELMPSDDSPIGRRVNELLPHVQVVTWSFSGLTAHGISGDIVLDLMAEADLLKDEITAKGWSFKRLARTICIHTICAWYEEFIDADQKPTHTLIERAADVYSRGVVNGNRALMKVGYDVVRYEIWRGEKNLEAYKKANRRPRAGLPPFRNRWFRDLMDIIRFEGPMAAMDIERQLASQESND